MFVHEGEQMLHVHQLELLLTKGGIAISNGSVGCLLDRLFLASFPLVVAIMCSDKEFTTTIKDAA